MVVFDHNDVDEKRRRGSRFWPIPSEFVLFPVNWLTRMAALRGQLRTWLGVFKADVEVGSRLKDNVDKMFILDLITGRAENEDP